MLDTRRVALDLLGKLELPPPKRFLKFSGCIALAGVAGWMGSQSSELSPAGARSLFILVLAAGLWISEAIPAFAVSLLVIGLQIALLGRTDGGQASGSSDWEQFAAVLGHPLIWLFFGGFTLAGAAQKTGLDRALALLVLARVGKTFAALIAGVMLVTFTLSLFMSNTATAAMVLALMNPVIRSQHLSPRATRGLLLCIAAAANVGGMGTLIGTPPNAIAVGGLASVGTSVDFTQWLFVGLPPALLLAALSAGFIVWRYGEAGPIGRLTIDDEGARRAPRWQQLLVVGVFLCTVLLWMTGAYHGIPTAAVSFVPIVGLTMTGILAEEEVRAFPWEVLLLLAGGLALGAGVQSTGLANWVIEMLPISGLATWALALSLAYTCALLSNVMSNTAAANVLVPIAVAMGPQLAAYTAVPVALAASAAMCLPIATPPNALAYSTGQMHSRDFLALGLVLLLLSPALCVLWVSWCLPLLGH